MMGSYDHIWAKSEMRGAVSLAMHLRQTAICAVYIAGWMGLDPRIARLGALLHDIVDLQSYYKKVKCGKI